MEVVSSTSDLLARIRTGLEGPLIVAVEGASGSGKTALSEKLQTGLGLPIVHTDDALMPQPKTPSYVAALDLQSLLQSIKLLDSSSGMIIEGLCARDTLRELGVAAQVFV